MSMQIGEIVSEHLTKVLTGEITDQQFTEELETKIINTNIPRRELSTEGAKIWKEIVDETTRQIEMLWNEKKISSEVRREIADDLIVLNIGMMMTHKLIYNEEHLAMYEKLKKLRYWNDE